MDSYLMAGLFCCTGFGGEITGNPAGIGALPDAGDAAKAAGFAPPLFF